jgi:hypothetical protein
MFPILNNSIPSRRYILRRHLDQSLNTRRSHQKSAFLQYYLENCFKEWNSKRMLKLK